MEIRVAKANPKTRFKLSSLYLFVVYLHLFHMEDILVIWTCLYEEREKYN